MVPRTESLSPSQGGSGHQGNLPGWLESLVVGALQGERGERRELGVGSGKFRGWSLSKVT